MKSSWDSYNWKKQKRLTKKSNTNCSFNWQKADKAVDEKADKKDEKKAENPITATKTVLEQLTSEAEVLNTTAKFCG